jgi:hypothetical protein
MFLFYRYTHRDIAVVVEAQVTTAKTRKEVSILSSVGIIVYALPLFSSYKKISGYDPSSRR